MGNSCPETPDKYSVGPIYLGQAGSHTVRLGYWPTLSVYVARDT